MKNLPKEAKECWCSICKEVTTAEQEMDFFVIDIQPMKVSIQAAREKYGLMQMFGGDSQPGALGLADVFSSRNFCEPIGESKRLTVCMVCAKGPIFNEVK